MSLIVSINSSPALQFYRLHEPAPAGAAWPLLLAVTERRISLDNEAPSVSITLDNRRGEASAVLADPPLRAEVSILLDDAVWFRGALSSVELAAQCRLTVIG